MARIDGQIWIDKNSPHRLKYYVAEEEYSVEVSANYEISSSDLDRIKVGSVITFSSSGNIEPAVFPRDIENVLGVASNITRIEDPYDSSNVTYTAAVSRSGFLIIENPSSIFLSDDLDITKNGWGNSATGIGAPVYWFIGKVGYSSGSYVYTEPETYPGYLTFSTPSGYRWNLSAPETNQLNVGYDNLPQVGTVAGYTIEGSTITELRIHLNFAKFDTSLEWSWPFFHYNHSPFEEGDCGLLSGDVESFLIRHGLFSTHQNNLNARCYCDILATDDPSNGENAKEYVISSGFSNKYTGTDRGTTLHISTPDSLYYRLSGRVIYEFDKNHRSS